MKINIHNSYFEQNCSISLVNIGEDCKQRKHALFAALPAKGTLFTEPCGWHLFRSDALRMHLKIANTNPNTNQAVNKIVYLWKSKLQHKEDEATLLVCEEADTSARGNFEKLIDTIGAASSEEPHQSILAQLLLAETGWPENGYWLPDIKESLYQLLETDRLPNHLYLEIVGRVLKLDAGSFGELGLHTCSFQEILACLEKGLSSGKIEKEQKLLTRLLVALVKTVEDEEQVESFLLQHTTVEGGEIFIPCMLGQLTLGHPQAEMYLQMARLYDEKSALVNSLISYCLATSTEVGLVNDPKVLVHAQTAHETDPEAFMASLVLGMHYFYTASDDPQSGQKSLSCLENLIQIDPSNLEANRLLGYLYSIGLPGIKRDHIKALAYFEKSLELDQQATTYLEAGLLCFEGEYGLAKDEQKALVYLKRAAELGIQDQKLTDALNVLLANSNK